MVATGPITVTVKVPEMEERLKGALTAVALLADAAEEKAAVRGNAHVSTNELYYVMIAALFPDGEHNDEICSLGLAVCGDCASTEA